MSRALTTRTSWFRVDARVFDGAYCVTVTQELVELLTRVQLPLGTQDQNSDPQGVAVLVPAVTTGVERGVGSPRFAGRVGMR